MAFCHLTCDLDCGLQSTAPLAGSPTLGSCFGSPSCSEICRDYRLLGRLQGRLPCFQALWEQAPWLDLPCISSSRWPPRVSCAHRFLCLTSGTPQTATFLERQGSAVVRFSLTVLGRTSILLPEHTRVPFLICAVSDLMPGMAPEKM